MWGSLEGVPRVREKAKTATVRRSEQDALATAIERVRGAIDRRVPKKGSSKADRKRLREVQDAGRVRHLCEAFGLSAFERDVVVLAAAMELESDLPALLQAAMGYDSLQPLTLRCAFAVLDNPHWSALSPGSPLRRWRLVEMERGVSTTLSPVRINERILGFLLDQHHLDESLAAVVSRVTAPRARAVSHVAAAERIVRRWMEDPADRMPAVVYLAGNDLESKLAVASIAAELLSAELYALSDWSLPQEPEKLEGMIRLWERETRLARRLLVLQREDARETPADRADHFAAHLGACLFVTSGRCERGSRPVLVIDAAKPSAAEQKALWLRALGDDDPALEPVVEGVVRQFDLGPARIESVAAEARALSRGDRAPSREEAVWQACRSQIRPELDSLARRIDSAARWEDLVLPAAEMRLIEEIALHLRNQFTVFGAWGFARGEERGLGLSALFEGASGTGKTLAAEVLSSRLNLPLYRVDLSSVVSKYIGETEKNLRTVFDAAEESGAVLLFDEADALFGKRSPVRDSHDRYANIEVSYLLQRMERYRGLAILTTNHEESIDAAFLRRIAYIVRFPFPGPAERREIWRRMFPPGVPVRGVDFEKLAQLTASGGVIRNMALKAALFAADVAEPVQMSHLLQAARSEHQKLGRIVSQSEVRGWV